MKKESLEDIQPLQYTCLENSVNGGETCRLPSMGRKESDAAEQLHLFTKFLLTSPCFSADKHEMVSIMSQHRFLQVFLNTGFGSIHGSDKT